MSACRVCGGPPEEAGDPLCEAHADEWMFCPERGRWRRSGDERSATALMDFINRARAERQNGGQHVEAR